MLLCACDAICDVSGECDGVQLNKWCVIVVICDCDVSVLHFCRQNL